MPERHGDFGSNNNEASSNVQDASGWDDLAGENAIGAKALAQKGFHKGRYSEEIVNSSFEKSRRRGERLESHKPAERRNEAYLLRIARAVEKHGNRLERRLWDASAKKLIVHEEDIPDSYWESQEQILRDEGRGYIKIGDYEKQMLTEDLQKHQMASLRSWSDYLGHEECPYPMWFKLYAWDGMSKMGGFDREKKEFRKRDKSTVAPYPKLNPAVLAKVYGVVLTFYGIGEGKAVDTKLSDEQLRSLVASGNFNRLYSRLLLEQKSAPEVPKNPEDVRGEWVEYLPGDEEKLAVAAEGTPWCVADPSVGRSYLLYGEYGHADYAGDDDENEAKFLLLHLEDPETGNLAESACASIRLGTDGNVAEISGLRDGQALDDALVPVVEEKVKLLPGGEEFLGAFADKKTLIKLDRKMKAGEDLTKEEYEFLYEINHPIRQLDTYQDDPRIFELRDTYGIEKALDTGIDIDDLVSKLERWDIAHNLGMLIHYGANIDNLVSKLDPRDIVYSLNAFIGLGVNIDDVVSKLESRDIADYLNAFIDHGANIDNLVSKLEPRDIAHNLDMLIDYGANIDNLVSKLDPRDIAYNLNVLIDHGANIDDLVSKLEPRDIVYYLGMLIDYGANINIDNLVSKLEPVVIAHNLDMLIDYGANINIDDLVSKLEPRDIAYYLNVLIDHGANIDDLVSKLEPRDIVKNLHALIDHGANIDNLVSKLESRDIANYLDAYALIDHGANIDDVVSKLEPRVIAYNLNALIDHGANINIDDLVSKLEPRDIVKNLNALIDHGANINIDDLVSKLEPWYIAYNLNMLISLDANIDNLVSKLEPRDIAYNLNALIDHGANIDDVVSKLEPMYIVKNLNALIDHGANIDDVVSKLEPRVIVYYLGMLIDYGANINIDDLVSKLEPRDIAYNLDALIDHGADVEAIRARGINV